MLDLGRSFLASVARDPSATALVEGDARWSYAEWFARVSAVADALSRLGLGQGDRLLTALRNSAAAATAHWACQLAGIAIVPVNWRATAEELDFYIENCGARALIFDAASREAALGSTRAGSLPRIAVGAEAAGAEDFEDIAAARAPDATPRATAEDWSLILYTSGTTARPKGVPRRHRAERAAALAHVAQNLMPLHDVTLGVMPLYHTMGVRSLLAMSLLGGSFVCLPRFDAGAALRLIARERIGSLYLVPTLYHDLLAHPDFAAADLASVRRLGFAGASMTDGLLRRVAAAFRPAHFVNHYGSSEMPLLCGLWTGVKQGFSPSWRAKICVSLAM